MVYEKSTKWNKMVNEKTKNGKKWFTKKQKMEKMVYEKTKNGKKWFKWKKGQSHWGGNIYMMRFKGNCSTVE